MIRRRSHVIKHFNNDFLYLFITRYNNLNLKVSLKFNFKVYSYYNRRFILNFKRRTFFFFIFNIIFYWVNVFRRKLTLFKYIFYYNFQFLQFFLIPSKFNKVFYSINYIKFLNLLNLNYFKLIFLPKSIIKLYSHINMNFNFDFFLNYFRVFSFKYFYLSKFFTNEIVKILNNMNLEPISLVYNNDVTNLKKFNYLNYFNYYIIIFNNFLNYYKLFMILVLFKI